MPFNNLSVALCTYNGARYVEAQIKSILNQTMPVGEIVVCDDGSTDGTLQIVESLAKAAPEVIHFFRNERHLGFKANFFHAIAQCHGELVFLADQDDVWHPDKVESIVAWFDAHPQRQAVFTNAALIDMEGKELKEDLWQRVGFDHRKQKFFDKGYGLEIWAWSNRATGATMAMRKHFVDDIDWEHTEESFHDVIIALQGITKQVLGFLDGPLMDYRVHADQTCGVTGLGPEMTYSPLKPCGSAEWMGFDINSLAGEERNRVDFLFKRAASKQRWFGLWVMANVPAYIRFYRWWAYKFFLYDLYVSIRHSFKRL